MKTKLFNILITVIFLGCRADVMTPVKTKMIAVHTFTGKGDHDIITNWFYIRSIVDRGASGYYFQSLTKIDSLKKVNFIYSDVRPAEFAGQAAAGEKIQFLDPDDLPGNILKDSSHLEALYR